MTVFSDAGVRATGLATRLVRRSDLGRLAALDRPALIEELVALGHLGPTPEPGGAAELELGLRRRAAEWLAVLGRWCGARAQVLVALFEAEERRAIRRMLRGAVRGAAAPVRARGLIPTRALPERALQLLSEAARPREVAARLLALGSPYGPPLFPEVESKEPDLFTLELALDRTFFERARSSARHADRHLQRYLQLSIDLTNADSALGLQRERHEAPPHDATFVEGGLRLSRAEYLRAIAAPSLEEAELILEERLHGAPRTLSDLIRFERESVRQDPTSTAPLVHFVLRLRAHLLDLSRLVWGGALGAPLALLEEGWVTP